MKKPGTYHLVEKLVVSGSNWLPIEEIWSPARSLAPYGTDRWRCWILGGMKVDSSRANVGRSHPPKKWDSTMYRTDETWGLTHEDWTQFQDLDTRKWLPMFHKLAFSWMTIPVCGTQWHLHTLCGQWMSMVTNGLLRLFGSKHITNDLLPLRIINPHLNDHPFLKTATLL